MKEIKGDLILKENYSIDDNLIVHGNIICEGGHSLDYGRAMNEEYKKMGVTII